MNEFRQYMSERNINKRWIKSQCLHALHVFTCKQAIGPIDENAINSVHQTESYTPMTEELILSQPGDGNEIQEVQNAFITATMLQLPESPLSLFLTDLVDYSTPQQISTFMNAPSPLDNLRFQSLVEDKGAAEIHKRAMSPGSDADEHTDEEGPGNIDEILQQCMDTIQQLIITEQEHVKTRS